MAESSATHVVVMGISGSGKTTLAQALAHRLAVPSAEADEFHPAANIEKMSAGIPLTDEDRMPWLAQLTAWMSSHADTGSVVTCSALKRSYRELLSQADGHVLFLEVDADPAVIAERMEHREGHFMPASLLPSQLATLEPLQADERGVRLPNTGTVQDLEDAAIAALGRARTQGEYTTGREHAASGTKDNTPAARAGEHNEEQA